MRRNALIAAVPLRSEVAGFVGVGRADVRGYRLECWVV
jgi:hypothetical protein